MINALFQHELIKTTLPKAKELRRFAEPLLTLAKVDGVSNRRLAFDRLRDKAVVGKLFVELGPRYRSRPGGYIANSSSAGSAPETMRRWHTSSWLTARRSRWQPLPTPDSGSSCLTRKAARWAAFVFALQHSRPFGLDSIYVGSDWSGLNRRRETFCRTDGLTCFNQRIGWGASCRDWSHERCLALLHCCVAA